MEPVTIGFLGIGLLVVLLFIGMPVGLAMALVGFIGFATLTNISGALGLLSTVPYSTLASYDFSILPLFLLMGAVAFHAGLSESLFRAAHKWVGEWRGGLAMATVLGCAGFSAVSGSTLATAVTMGKMALPEMKRHGYHPSLATGTVAAAGSLGILIPPSSIFVLYGLMTEQSIGALFIAGILPGFLLTLLFMGSIYLQTLLRADLGPPGPKTSWIEKIVEAKRAIPVLIVFLVIIGGLYLGLFTPTEAAGAGAFIILVYGIVCRRLTRRGLSASLLESLKTTAMIFVILIGAQLFGTFIAISRLPSEIASFLVGLQTSPYIILALIVVIYIFLGCLMDTMAMVVLTVPIFYPIILSLGFDPIWFGVMMVLVSEMGVITPPIGVNVYAVCGIAKDIDMVTVFRGTLPFFIAMIICVIIVSAFPGIATFLPSLIRY